MEKLHRIPIYGSVPSLSFGQLCDRETVPDLLVKSWGPYTRFAAEMKDDGMHSFGFARVDMPYLRTNVGRNGSVPSV